MTNEKMIIAFVRNHRVLLFVLVVFVVYGIYSVISFNNDKDYYHYISLENITCAIPLRMWHPDEDDVFISDHMFRITDNEGDYIIYASQLEQYDADDEQNGLFYRFDEKLLNYYSDYQVCNGIKESSDVLENVVDTDVITKNGKNPPYVFYRIQGEAGGQYAGYNTYISTSKFRDYDVRFVFILLYRDPEELSDREMSDMWEHYAHGESLPELWDRLR